MVNLVDTCHIIGRIVLFGIKYLGMNYMFQNLSTAHSTDISLLIGKKDTYRMQTSSIPFYQFFKGSSS